MTGILLSIISGICMTLQGVFNTKVSEKLGIFETTVLVQGSAFLLSLTLLFLFSKSNFKSIMELNKLYLTGGILGVIIIFTVIQGIKTLGTTCSIVIILIAQLLSASMVDAFGLFGTEQVPFNLSKILGIVLMIIGIIVFKWKC